ncbi:MAG: VWA domain-containing protein, partial [Thermoplasmata archaeon]|nr:VWA domain-containing protein [Thermoplasmata archaeon]
HHVNITIQDQYSKTVVDQAFYNPYNFTIIGTYVFPIPEGAVISKFTIYIDDKEYPGEIIDANEAEELFTQAVIELSEPSLLQYLDNNIISMDITIAPHESKRIILEYEEILNRIGGMYHYLYTLSTEQYSAADIEEVSLYVDISSSKNINTVYCSSHDVIIQRRSENNIVVKYSEENSRPNRDFELFYSNSDEAFGSGLLTYHDGEQGYFMFFLNSNGTGDENYIPKDIVFVIDQSGSMSGEKIVQAKDALAMILQQLQNDDRFDIINFDSEIYTYSEIGELIGVNVNNINAAISYVNEIGAGGSTNINDALLTGINTLGNTKLSSSARIIFFLTDGLPTAGETNEETIVSNVYNANIVGEVDASIFVFGVGYDVNNHLLDKISNQNHGARVYVDPEESIEDALTELYGKVASPIFTDISIEFEGITSSEIYPEDLPDLYVGSEIVLVGKYDHLNEINPNKYVSALVDGTTSKGASSMDFEFEISESNEYSFIPRIWASRKIGMLLDKIRLEGETPELVEEVKELGMKYGIVTPYTSMFIEEQDGGPTEGMESNNLDNDGDGVPDAWEKSGSTSNDQSGMNFAYQQSDRAYTTSGANIESYGNKLFVEFEGIYIELELLADYEKIELQENETIKDWILTNLDVSTTITFASEDYFALVKNKDVVEILAVGRNLVFEYNNDIYFIVEGEIKFAISNINAYLKEDNSATFTWYTNKLATSILYYRAEIDQIWKIEQSSIFTTRHSFTIKDLSNGSYEYYVTSKDESDIEVIEYNDGKFYRFSLPIVNPPLKITDVTSEVTETTVTITWDTDRPSTSEIAYRLKGSESTWTIEIHDTLTEYHTIVLADMPYGEYEYYVSSNDEDGIATIDEIIRYCKVEFPDQDLDWIDDNWEIKYGLNPSDPSDANKDNDMDGLTNIMEFKSSTNPNSKDTDNDNMPDSWEINYELDPNNPSDAFIDSDNDGSTNIDEYLHDTNPLDSNSRYNPGREATEDENAFLIQIIIVVVIITIFLLLFGFAKSRRGKENFYNDYLDATEYQSERITKRHPSKSKKSKKLRRLKKSTMHSADWDKYFCDSFRLNNGKK